MLKQKKEEFKEFVKKTRAEYDAEAKELKAVLAETQKKAKKQVKEYKAQVALEHKKKLAALKGELSKAGPEARDSIKKQIEEEKTEYINKLSITKEEAKKRALTIMKEVGIPDPEKRYNQYPFEFSGGMRQRIVIAIALTASPEILICDEPTTALDVTIQAQILELINRIKEERKLSVIFITHDLGVVANMADRVAVMYAGKIVEYGTAEEIFYDPKHPYTWALLSSIPDVDSKEKLEAIPGTPPNMIYPPKGDAFAARSKYAMNIDFREQPEYYRISDTHYTATWLLDPKAPKVEMPKIVSDRIRISLEEDKKHEQAE
ncbi:MAG: ATP-binding cassette domain-containing protein [Lachnospiraceae bacterium]|nr:ATP-binding cassette domain-containing protein [Lachnospiraceae bacterium]